MAEKEYIEREAVNALIKAECSPKVAAYLIDAVATIHAADVRPVRRGKWTCRRTLEHDGGWWCTACGNELTIYMGNRSDRYNFCPNCGADMRPQPPKEET